ncbi:MAG: hypothetical protein ABGX21_05985, partial [Candidatus Poseidoniia archaeon]
MDKTEGDKVKAIGLIVLMILLPWGANPPLSSNLELQSQDPNTRDEASGKSWGENGSNDTGWLVLDATGADAANGTPALADLIL